MSTREGSHVYFFSMRMALPIAVMFNLGGRHLRLFSVRTAHPMQ
jgi:hypothetical protein